MKKFLAALLSVFSLTSSYAATIAIQPQNPAKKLEQHFRDVRSDSSLNKAINSAISRRILEKGSFFRPEDSVPAIMFFKVLLRDNNIKIESNKFPDILKLAVKSELIEEKIARNLQFNTPITNLRAIKSIIKAKKILPPRRVSQKFRGIYPFINMVKSNDLPYIETAVASGILNKEKLRFFQPNKLATRRDFITWIYNYYDHGSRQNRLEADKVFRWNERSFRDNSRLKSRFSIRKRALQQQKIKAKQKLLNKPKKSRDLQIKTFNQEIINKVKNPFPGKDVLDEVYNEIMERYRFVDDLTAEKKQKMVDKSLSALVKAIGDKYSIYIKPTKSRKYKELLHGRFEGIGAYVEMVDGKFTIISPIVGSPAEKAGLQPQDIVIEVNGEKTEGLSINEIVDRIMGPAGTSVDLKISRDSKKLNFTVVRDKIIVPEVTLKWEKGVPIVGIHRFTENTSKSLKKYLNEVLAKKPRGIIFDLRNNPGGLLSSAVQVSEIFLKKDAVILYTDDRDSKKQYLSRFNGMLSNFPGKIIVLQNKGTASSSEILIAALRDYKIVDKVIGEKSLGKGTAQIIRDLQNGGLLKLTVSRWLTPHKNWINGIGIIPDLEIPNPTNEERKKGIDKQLDIAIREILK